MSLSFILHIFVIQNRNIDNMAEHLTVAQGTKSEKYETLFTQIKSLVESETDLIANMANVA